MKRLLVALACCFLTTAAVAAPPKPAYVTGAVALLASYTVANLPAAPPDGAMALATDCTLTAITGLGLAPTGGGTNKVVVYAVGGGWLML